MTRQVPQEQYMLQARLPSSRKNDNASAPEVYFSRTWLWLQLRSSWYSWVQLRIQSSLFS